MPKKKYTLVICEKPKAAIRIAYALADKTPAKRNFLGIPYWEVECQGKKLVVASAVGHLYGLAEKEKSQKWPVFDLEWRPTFSFVRKYTNALINLTKEASDFIIACDYDIEGELIGFNALRFICHQEDAKRMKFSTLTKPELLDSYKNIMQHVDFGQAYAGETRHFLDYYYGVNLSRALMQAIKTAGAFKILSIGRVQGPSLALVAEREKEIQAFKPEPYWQVFLLIKNKHNVEVKYPQNIFNEKEAKTFEKLKGRTGEAATTKEEKKKFPWPPFDLTTLQIEAYKLFGLSPAQTLAIAQGLYLAGLISYPRTSSQKLPPTIGYKRILDKLDKLYPQLAKHLARDYPIQGKKCVAGNTTIILPNGQINSIKEVVNNNVTNEVSGMNELKTVNSRILDRFSIKNKKKIINITLQTHDKISVTPDHRLLVLKDGVSEWLEARDIKKGMLIASPEKIKVKRQSKASTILEIFDMFSSDEQTKILLKFKKEIKEIIKNKKAFRTISRELCKKFKLKINTVRSYFQRLIIPYLLIKTLLEKKILSLKDVETNIKQFSWAGAGGNVYIKLPFYLNQKFLYFIGFIAADGHNTGREIQIPKYPSLMQNFLRFCLFFSSKINDYGNRLSINSKLLCEILNKLSVWKGNKAPRLDISNFILKQPDSMVLSFIAGYFDGDGSVYKTQNNVNVSIASCSRLFLKKLKSTLLTFGIVSRFHKNDIRIYQEYIPKFNSTLNKFLYIKRENLKNLSGAVKPIQSIRKIFIPRQKFKDKLKGNNLNLSQISKIIGSRIRFSEKFEKNYYFTKTQLNRIAQILKDKHLSTLANNDTIWLEVKETSSRRYNDNVYDLTTQTHNFIGNDIILHNCDPAHPSIFCTGEKPSEKLSKVEKQVYELIVKRFLACFSADAFIEEKKIIAKVDDKEFIAKGKKILEPGWLAVYPAKIEEKELPDVEGKVKVKDVRLEEKETQAPKRYSPASLISELEKRNLGTKCLTSNTLVRINSNNQILNIKISELFDDLCSNSPARNIKGMKIAINNKNTCFSFNEFDVVKSHFKLVSKRKLNKNERVYRIEYKDGSYVELTEDHPVLIFNGSSCKYIQTKNLRKGMKSIASIKSSKKEGKIICTWENFLKKCNSKTKLYGISNEILKRRKEQNLSQKAFGKKCGIGQSSICSYEKSKNIPFYIIKKLNLPKPKNICSANKNLIIKNPFPLRINSSLARILANLIGDCSIDSEKIIRENCYDFRYHNIDINLINKFLKDVKTVFGINLSIKLTKSKLRHLPKYYIRIPAAIGRIISILFSEVIKKNVVKISPKFYPEFIGALFDDEGHAMKSEPKLFISNTNFKLLEDVKEMLSTLNINASLEKKQFKLYIRGRENIQKFLEKIPFTSIKKKQRLIDDLTNRYSWKNYPIIKRERDVLSLLNLSKEKELMLKEIAEKLKVSIPNIKETVKSLRKKGFVKKIIVGISEPPRKRITYRLIKPIENTIYSYIGEKVINAHFITKTIKSIKKIDYDGFVYDITNNLKIPNFILSNGIVVHNSTRSTIIDTLYKRGYVFGRQIQVTRLGLSVASALEKNCPLILDEKLTRKFEQEMQDIREEKNKENMLKKKEQTLKEARELLVKISKQFKEHEKEIGKELAKAHTEEQIEQKKANALCKCPICKKGTLIMIRSRRGKRFAGCDRYPECKASYALPQYGLIKLAGKKCECGFPTLLLIMKGRPPWEFCFNPECPIKKEKAEKKAKQEEEKKLREREKKKKAAARKRKATLKKKATEKKKLKKAAKKKTKTKTKKA